MLKLSKLPAFKSLSKDVDGNKEFEDLLVSVTPEANVPALWNLEKTLGETAV